MYIIRLITCWNDKVECISPEAALAKLNGVKILSVLRIMKPGYAKSIKDTFGIEIERVTFDELNSASRAIPAEEAKKVADAWAGSASGSRWRSSLRTRNTS